MAYKDGRVGEKRNRFWGAFLLFALMAPAVAFAQAVPVAPAAQSVAGAVAQVIERQLKALRDRDAGAVFAEVASDRRGEYKNNPKTYLNALRLKYHALYDHSSFRFLDVSVNGPMAVHKVELVDRTGHRALALFRLTQQPDGTWKIRSVVVVDDPDERGV